MEVPKELLYTKEHEWVRVDGGKGTIGITAFAQDQLGDVVFVQLPEVGADLVQEKEFGVVESVKTVSDLYSPCNGKVTQVNKELESQPELVNAEPYGKGWIIEIELEGSKAPEGLLSADEYAAFIKEQS